jgi:hypothetical protein
MLALYTKGRDRFRQGTEGRNACQSQRYNGRNPFAAQGIVEKQKRTEKRSTNLESGLQPQSCLEKAKPPVDRLVASKYVIGLRLERKT